MYRVMIVEDDEIIAKTVAKHLTLMTNQNRIREQK